MIIGIIGFLIFSNTLSNTMAAERAAYSRIEFSCQQNETWFFGQKLPLKLVETLSNVKHDSEGAIEFLLTAPLLKQKFQTAEARGIIDFMMNRSLYDLGMVHLANKGFQSLISLPETEALTGIRIAALGCMSQIHLAYSSIRLMPQISTLFSNLNVRKIWPDQRRQFWETMTLLALRKFAENGKSADISVEKRQLEFSDSYLTLIQTIEAILNGNEAGAIEYSNRLLKKKNLPHFIEEEKDTIHLNLGRIYYNQRKFKEAIQEFNEVHRKSNLLTQAIIGKAWAYLMLNDPSSAVGAAYSLLVGELRNTFEPDAAIIAAIAFFEACHYSQSLQSISFFRKRYDSSYRWLYDWRQQEKKGIPNDSLYPSLTEALRTKKTSIPFRILTEWSRSPVFLGWQAEINLLEDEKQNIERLMPYIDEEYANMKKKYSIPSSVPQELKKILRTFSQGISQTQKSLISGINHELAFLNHSMTTKWIGAYENSQLVEVEIFNATGETLLRKSTQSKKESSSSPEISNKDSSGMPVLNWGTYSIKDDEKSETWEDETGFQSNVESLCNKRK